MKYAKLPLVFSKQLDLLASRGLTIGGRAEAVAFLSRVNYYRLSAYCIPFEQARHAFLPGAKFEQVQALYELDRKLRQRVMEAVEIIEVATRTALAYHLSQRYGPFAHSAVANFRDPAKHAEWMAEVLKETGRSRETFVSHFKATYDEYPQLPIWAAVEIMSFGSLSKLFAELQEADKTEIAKTFGLHRQVFVSWLHTLVYIRNICAHHARLWNRELAIAPKLPKWDRPWKGLDPAHARRMSRVLFLLSDLMGKLRAQDGAAEVWRKSVEQVLETEPGICGFLEDMGLPTNWTQHPLWTPGREINP